MSFPAEKSVTEDSNLEEMTAHRGRIVGIWMIAVVAPAVGIPFLSDELGKATRRGFFVVTFIVYLAAFVLATVRTKFLLRSVSRTHSYLKWFAEEGIAWVIWLIVTFAALNYSVYQIYKERPNTRRTADRARSLDLP